MDHLAKSEIELKANLYFHISNPLKRWRVERVIPIKLILQIIKTFCLIVQVQSIGADRGGGEEVGGGCILPCILSLSAIVVITKVGMDNRHPLHYNHCKHRPTVGSSVSLIQYTYM